MDQQRPIPGRLRKDGDFMRQVSFDKERAEQLMAALRNREPIVVEGRDLFLLAGICYFLLQAGLEGVVSPPSPGKHLEHLELEVWQGSRDLFAAILFASTLVLDLRMDSHDEHFDAKVTAEVEMTQEPRYLVNAVRGFRPGGPFEDMQNGVTGFYTG